MTLELEYPQAGQNGHTPTEDLNQENRLPAHFEGDSDSDVDQSDLGVPHRCPRGANRPADPNDAN